MKTTSLPDLPSDGGQPVLTIDLDAVGENYRFLKAHACGARVGGVVKADGYGLGAAPIAKVLVEMGCDLLFAANVKEASELRQALGPDPEIFVFSGYSANVNNAFFANNLSPVLNSLSEMEDWAAACRERGLRGKAGVHIDTGMTRLGLSPREVAGLAADRDVFDLFELAFVMGHLACADQPEHPLNAKQLNDFMALSDLLPAAPKSLANSAGLLNGPEYCFDIVRPGIGLYGGEPLSNRSTALKPVAYLHAPILQVHEIDKGTCVGYGATYKVERQSRIAVVGVGYADGYMRHLSDAGCGFLGHVAVPIAGRISMDLTAFDVTDAADTLVHVGSYIELLGARLPVETVGRMAGTFGYEILTNLGQRYARRYIWGGDLI